MDISKLLTAPEGKTLEFKRDTSALKKMMRTIVAFANTSGGTVVIGQEDNGRVVGVNNPLLIEEQLTNSIADSIAPLIRPEIEIGPTIRVVFPPHPLTIQKETETTDNNVPVNKRQQWFLEQLKQGIQCKPTDIAKHWEVVEKTAKRDIGDLQKKGLGHHLNFL